MRICKVSDSFNVLLNLINTGEARLHFSQLGEDVVLWHLFESKSDGFYVDVGCHHPYRYSNTALLSTFKSWKGINIDLDERSINAFRAIRPNDANVNVAIGLEEGEAVATIFEDGAVNSLDPDVAAHQSTIRPGASNRTISVRPLAAVLKENLPENQTIDFMNIDAEGWDHLVLQSNNWDLYRPEIIAVESHGFDLNNPKSNQTFQYLIDRGYSLMSHVVVTSIYRRLP